jgi:hypothetical protein
MRERSGFDGFEREIPMDTKWHAGETGMPFFLTDSGDSVNIS